MKRQLFSATLLAAAIAASSPLLAKEPISSAGGFQAAAQTVPDPAVQIREWTRLFRADDVAGLAQALVPPAQWEEIRLLHELAQLEHISDEERARFAETIDRITAPDAVDRLMLDIEPQLEKARPQYPGALMMAYGLMHMAIHSPDSELSDDQRAALQSVVPGLQQWASSTDFLSSDTMRQALTLLTDAARQSGITDIDQLTALPLDALLDRARPVLSAAKQAVRLYGIDLDAVAGSLRTDVLAIDGDTARVRSTVTLFGAPVWAEHELVLIEGRWYVKATVDRWHSRSVASTRS